MNNLLLEAVYVRAEYRCEYCQLSLSMTFLPFEIDHIIPKKHDGSSDFSNLCLACWTCNNRKGTNIAGLLLKPKRLVPLFNPRIHKWSRHFRWDGPNLIGKTDIGEVTVFVLDMNLSSRVELREQLIKLGEFPPSSIQKDG